MTVKTGQVIAAQFILADPTGLLVVADAPPTGVLVVAGVDNAAVVTITTPATGLYKWAVTLPALTAGAIVQMRVAPVLYGVTLTRFVWADIADTKLVSDLNDLAAGALMGLADDAITSAKFDESSAFPLKAADALSTQVARVGADSDTLETLSDQIDNLDSDVVAVANQITNLDGDVAALPDCLDIADCVWDEILAGHVLPGSAAVLLMALYATMGSGIITVVSPVSLSGDVTIWKCDDYLDADGRALDWMTIDAATWPVLTGAVVTFYAGTFSHLMTVVTGTGVNKKVRLELTTGDTCAMCCGSGTFTIKAVLLGGSVVTLATGTLTVEGCA